MNKEGNQKRSRVVHVVSELRAGGVEIRLLELMRQLGEEARDHTILTVSGRKGPLAPEFEKTGARVAAQTMRSVLYPPLLLSKLLREKPAAIHSYINHTSGLQMLVAWLSRVPVRITNFRSDGVRPKNALARTRRQIMDRLIRVLSTDIVGVSPSTLDANVLNWRHNPKCQVIVNGFVVNEGRRPEDSYRGGRYSEGRDYPTIVHVGRADIPTKNRQRAISISAAIKRLGYPHRMIFIGRHGATETQAAKNLTGFELQARDLGVEHEVQFIGERDDVPALLRSADCLLVTSTLEGLPGVVLEALIEDTPVVSTDLPGAVFIQKELRGVKCVSLSNPDEIWARAIISWIEEWRTSAKTHELSLQVASSQFNITKQVVALKRLWGTNES